MADKYAMKLTKEDFDGLYERIHKEAYEQGFKEGHINGLALAVAYIYKHVEDLGTEDPDSNYYNILTDFQYEVDRMRRMVS